MLSLQRLHYLIVAACVAINLFPRGQTLSFLASPAYRLGRHAVSSAWPVRSVVASLDMAANNVEILAEDDNGEDEVVEPGQMRVSEIKAELDMRSISYNDCFDKESLVERLKEARAMGKADPSILEKFNRQKVSVNAGIFAAVVPLNLLPKQIFCANI